MKRCQKQIQCGFQLSTMVSNINSQFEHCNNLTICKVIDVLNKYSNEEQYNIIFCRLVLVYNPEFTIVFFIHYKPRIAVAILAL